eukprot:scaffold140302_cov22-Tisochrysis_lutea.AAC.1
MEQSSSPPHHPRAYAAAIATSRSQRYAEPKQLILASRECARARAHVCARVCVYPSDASSQLHAAVVPVACVDP